MVTRITTAGYYSAILADLSAAQNRENIANQQVATGKIGNDLVAFGSKTSNVVATSTVQARVDTMVDQLKSLNTKMTFQQTAVQQVGTVADQLKLALTTALGENTGDGLMATVQNLFSQAADALNTQYGGDYIFSGGQTQTKPFTATDLTQLTAGNPAVNSFFKDGTLVPTSQVDDNQSIQTGFLASGLGTNLMAQFQSIESFQQGATGSFGGALTQAQQDFLTTAIASLNTVSAQTTTNSALGGDMQARVTAAATTQTDRQTTLKNALGDMTSINTADAAAALTQAQTQVQAAAQVFTTLKSMSLLNYLSPTTTG